MKITQALARSLLDLFHPRMLMLLFLPPLASILIWGLLGYFFWNELLQFSHFFGDKFFFSHQMPPWLVEYFSITPASIEKALAIFVAVLLLLPLTILTSVILTSVLAMPVVLRYLKRSFPQLEEKGKGAVVASTRNLVRSSLIYLALWLITVPLWLVPGLGIAVPLLLNGYLNYRLFAFDALADFASPRELKVLLHRKRIDYWILGVLISALVLLPPLFLIMPVYSALSFARYSLMELQEYRSKA